jgi:aryl-alcohol dehydrogenase-like predicted oxidoreductase
LATKFGNPRMPYEGGVRSGGSRAAVLCAIEGSLKRLDTDWIDLYQMHMPDSLTPIEETLRALDDLVKQGKVRFTGCSNFPAWQVVESQWTARHLGLKSFTTCQNEYNLLVRNAEEELIPAMEKYGIGLLPYFPLAAGLLTGKYRRDSPPPPGARFASAKRLAERYLSEANWNVVDRLVQFCSARGRTLLELAFAWLLSRSVVSSVIAGATSPEQVQTNVRASAWRLSADEIKEVCDLTN